VQPDDYYLVYIYRYKIKDKRGERMIKEKIGALPPPGADPSIMTCSELQASYADIILAYDLNGNNLIDTEEYTTTYLVGMLHQDRQCQ